MPWDAEVRHGEGRSDYKSEKRCQRTSLAFYQAVRDGLPPWLLEDMRRMEVFHWEAGDGRARAFSPAEALLYALVHDHQAYARHLLAGFSVAALEPPGGSFRCCGASGPPPHLAAAVRYGRVAILKMMLAALKDLPSEGARRRFLDGRGGCPHDAGKTAVRLACDLLRPECLLLLLGHGASPGLGDGDGDGAGGATPLDALLRRMSAGEPARGAAEARGRRVCLGYLLLFTPRPHQGLLHQRRLAELEPEQWRRLVGAEAFRWLAGAASPPSLFVRAMQTLVRAVPAERLDCLPGFLKPIDFPL